MSQKECISCLEKQVAIKQLFEGLNGSEAFYRKIMELGKTQVPIDRARLCEDLLVPGCQSRMYLLSEYHPDSNTISFQTESDALISAGLGAFMTRAYSGETPEVILRCPPLFLEELGLPSALSPTRANGLYSLHLKMKQIALKYALRRDIVNR